MTWHFSAPPGWPPPPAGFEPPPGWTPDPTWPPAPPGWQFWLWVEPAVQPVAVVPEPPVAVVPGPEVAPQVAADPAAAPAHLGWHERRELRREELAHAQAVTRWQAEQDALDGLVRAAQDANDGGLGDAQGLVLARGETALFAVRGAALIEPRRGAGHYQGGYSGVSLHIAKGVSYRIGGTRGHYVPGPETQTPVDVGTAVITTTRVVFTGTKATREWAYAKLLGVDDSPDGHALLLHVANRERVSGLVVGPVGPTFHGYLALGIGIHRNGAAQALAHATEVSEGHRATRP